jgi:hypothetical protein
MKRESARKRGLRRVGRSPKTVAAHKRLFIAALQRGMSPTYAAKKARMGYSTAFKWRSEDEEFAQAWLEAVNQGIDKLEDKSYQIAMRGNVSMLQFLLRHRRPGVFGERAFETATHEVKMIPMEEAVARLEHLGLPVPVIETDFDVIEEGDAPAAGRT